MFSEDLTVLGFDNNGSKSAQQSSPNEESNYSGDNFSGINRVQVRKRLKT